MPPYENSLPPLTYLICLIEARNCLSSLDLVIDESYKGSLEIDETPLLLSREEALTVAVSGPACVRRELTAVPAVEHSLDSWPGSSYSPVSIIYYMISTMFLQKALSTFYRWLAAGIMICSKVSGSCAL